MRELKKCIEPMKTNETVPTILVVDDNHQNIKLLCGILNTEQYNLAVALGGNDALEIMESTPVDLLLLDIMMPVMDGFETCTVMKSKENLKDIPVIFVSALTDTDNLDKAFDVGGVDYIHKPVRDKELLYKVKTHLEHAETKKQLKELGGTGSETSDVKLDLSGIMNLKSKLLPGKNAFDNESFDCIIVQGKTNGPSQGFYQFLNKKLKSFIILGNNNPQDINGLIADFASTAVLNAMVKNGMPEDTVKALEYVMGSASFPPTKETKIHTNLGILIIDQENRKLNYSASNLPLVYYSFDSDSFEVIENTKGKSNPEKDMYTIDFHPKDRIYLFTRNQSKTEDIILKTIKQDLESQKQSLTKELENQDLTIVGIEIKDYVM